MLKWFGIRNAAFPYKTWNAKLLKWKNKLRQHNKSVKTGKTDLAKSWLITRDQWSIGIWWSKPVAWACPKNWPITDPDLISKVFYVAYGLNIQLLMTQKSNWCILCIEVVLIQCPHARFYLFRGALVSVEMTWHDRTWHEFLLLENVIHELRVRYTKSKRDVC